MDILLINDFRVLCIDHLENTGSLSCAAVPNADMFHYTLPKRSHIPSCYHQSHQKTLYWKVVTLSAADKSFPQF